MAAGDFDAGRPCPSVGPFFPPGPRSNFRVIQEPAAELPLRHDESGHVTDSRSSLVCSFWVWCRPSVGPTLTHFMVLATGSSTCFVESSVGTKVRAVAKVVAVKNPAELDEIRAGRPKFWTQRAKHFQKERLSWLQGAPETLKPLLAGIHGPFLSEPGIGVWYDRGLANALQQGLLFVGVLNPSPGFCKPGGFQCCDLSVLESKKQRSDRNKYVLSKVKPSEWSHDLWDETVTYTIKCYMSWSMLLDHLDQRHAFATRRLSVREQGPNGMRTRPVYDFTESGINPATRPLDAVTHETVDHVLSLLLVCLQGKTSPKMWKRDVSESFRRVLSESHDLCWVVFGHEEHVWVSQHKSLPFDSTSAVHGWHRIGCLLKDMVCVFLAPCCRC